MCLEEKEWIHMPILARLWRNLCCHSTDHPNQYPGRLQNPTPPLATPWKP
jgi:hypothetical protein